MAYEELTGSDSPNDGRAKINRQNTEHYAHEANRNNPHGVTPEQLDLIIGTHVQGHSNNLDDLAAKLSIPIGDLVGTTDGQPLHNKVMNNMRLQIATATFSSGAAETLSSARNYQLITLAANATSLTWGEDVWVAGEEKTIIFELVQGAGGPFTIAWGSEWEWLQGGPPDLAGMAVGERCFVIGSSRDNGATIHATHNKPKRGRAHTSGHTFELVDDEVPQTFDSASALTGTISSAVSWPTHAGIPVLQVGAGPLTIQGDASTTVNGALNGSVTLDGQYKSAYLFHLGSNVWVVTGAVA